MFQTFDVHQKLSPFLNEGENGWDLISYTLKHPWFYANIRVNKKNKLKTHERVIMVDTVERLKEFHSRKDVEFLDLELVTPRHVNKTGKWKMEALKEVWLQCAANPNDEFDYEYLYVLDSGETYTSMAVPPTNMGKDKCLIFSWKE